MRIKISNLQHTYPGNVVALRGISLNIESGEQVAIVGQNGAGKTTLVKHLNGLLQPSGGDVLIGNWNTRTVTVAKLASRVGYVFQNPDEQLFCKTVDEEVAFGSKNLGFAPEKIEQLVNDALSITELSNKRDINPYDLSPSWRKMVALASIISMDTPIVIFDEPTTGQDGANVARIANVIAQLRRRVKTVITITHDIDFCVENFERVVVLSQGNVLLDGPASQVLGELEILASTYVDPPQLIRLSQRLGFDKRVCNQQEFIAKYREWLKNGV